MRYINKKKCVIVEKPMKQKSNQESKEEENRKQ